MVAEENLVASLKLKTWAAEIKPRYTGYNQVQRQKLNQRLSRQNDIYRWG